MSSNDEQYRALLRRIEYVLGRRAPDYPPNPPALAVNDLERARDAVAAAVERSNRCRTPEARLRILELALERFDRVVHRAETTDDREWLARQIEELPS